MDTRTLCLGALTRGDATGYEIKKCLEESLGYFLDVSHSAIYPALADLHRDSLVTCTEIEQRGKPDKKSYSLTAAGEEAFVDALMTSPARHKVRSEFLAVLFFADFLPEARLRQVMNDRLEEFEGLKQLAERWLVDEGNDAPPGVRFTAGYGLAILKAACTYIRENRQLLETEITDPVRPAAGRHRQ